MPANSAFTAFMSEAEPRLSRALMARFGLEHGRDATLDAMVYAWQHWDRVEVMDNAVGYLYRVGCSSVRPRRPPPRVAPSHDYREPWIEPGLEGSLDELSPPQRVSVVLRHSFEWTLDEIAELLDVSVRTVRTHLSRGMDKLRSDLEVSVND